MLLKLRFSITYGRCAVKKTVEEFEKRGRIITAILIILLIILVILFTNYIENLNVNISNTIEDINFKKDNTFKLISSTENQDLESFLMDFANKENINLEIDYAGTIDIMQKLNNGEEYDATDEITVHMFTNTGEEITIVLEKM